MHATKTMHDFNRAAKPALPVPPTSHALFEASSAEPRKANLKGYAPLSQRSDWQHLGICWFKTLVKTLLVNYQWESKMTPRGGISRELPWVFLGPELWDLIPLICNKGSKIMRTWSNTTFIYIKKLPFEVTLMSETLKSEHCISDGSNAVCAPRHVTGQAYETSRHSNSLLPKENSR